MSETENKVLRDKVREMQVLIDGLSTNNIHMERQLSQMQECEEKLKQEQAQIQILQKELQDNKDHLYRLREELLKKTSYIAEVQSGIGWRMLVYYRKKIRNRLAPIGTKRRINYDKFLKRLKFK